MQRTGSILIIDQEPIIVGFLVELLTVEQRQRFVMETTIGSLCKEEIPAVHDSYRIMIAQDDAALASLLTRLILRRYPTAVVQAFGTDRRQ